MEFILMNIGIFVLIVLFMGASFIFPLTIAYVVAVVFMVNVGVAGYFLSFGGEMPVLLIGGLAISLALDIGEGRRKRFRGVDVDKREELIKTIENEKLKNGSILKR